jgi:signal transduction histidine kinase
MKYSGQSRDIELRLRAEHDSALIQVADRGIGIPLNERGRIFENFYRASAAQKSGIPGAGLGLPLVTHIAKAHGGAVEVESEVGKGSTFTIRIPIHTRSAS